MRRLLSYLYQGIKNPSQKDFVSMGLGIEARYERCKKFWEPHLKLSKEIQTRAVEGLGSFDSIAVLGAGRLFDVHRDLVGKFKQIHLYDADPSCISTWRIFGSAFQPHVGDLTGSLTDWTKKLWSVRKEPSHRVVECINALEPGSWPQLSAEVVFSLNLLGQIPIYWRDRAIAILEKFHGTSAEQSSLDKDIEQALVMSYQRLQDQHLQFLANSGAERILLVSDRYFHAYTSERAEWDTESALYISEPLLIEQYTRIELQTWLWHIAPQGIEYPEYGMLHEIVASIYSINA